MDTFLLGVLTLLAVALTVTVIAILLRRTQGSQDISTPIQNLTQAIQQNQAQTAVLAEKLTRLEPLAEAVSSVQIELRGLSERILQVEHNQNQVGQSIVELGTGLTQTGTVAKSLVDATKTIQDEISRAKNDLTELQTIAKVRQEIEKRTAESIRRLEAIIAGTQTKGAAGENILEVVFSKLPPDWQVRNFRVGDKAVEFGLRLPNNLVLPIDSKWAATNLLEKFMSSDDPGEQQNLKSQIEAVVLNKAREVRKYIDPNMTVNFGVAAVPDAIYDLCSGIQAEVFQLNVVLVSYSMFVPYLLLVFQTILKASHNIDLQKLDSYLHSADYSISALQHELEGRFSKAITMLSNSRDDMSTQLSKVRSGLTSLKINSSKSSEEAALDNPESINKQSDSPSSDDEGKV
ncbi:MAG: DNA recombination protein RmuC [Candidatus Dadabacteria bacterium]|nr:DNA recombination protein RmuC [Candidatus Dadabacteria bacterium]